MYKTIVLFTDLQDNSFKYLPGDVFPREGLEVSEARIKELSTTANRRGIALIKAVTEDTANDTSEKFSEDMNPPVEPIEEAEAENEEAEEKPKAARGRKKKDAE